MENKVTEHSPTRWTDPFLGESKQQRPTNVAPTELLSLDINELAQAALWHWEQRCIAQANGATAEAVVGPLPGFRSQFDHFAKPARTKFCVTTVHIQSTLRFVRIQTRSMQAIRSCVVATVRRDLRELVTPTQRPREERVTSRWRRLLLLAHLVLTASAAQLCLMTQDEIRERNLREAQEMRERLRAINQESKQAVGKNDNRNKKSQQMMIPATVLWELEPSKRPPTGGWPM